MTAREALNALYGAWRLARFDRGGLAYFDASSGGALRSFAVVWFVLPAFCLTTVMEWRIYDQWPAAPVLPIVAYGIAYLVKWAGFLTLVDWITGQIGRPKPFASFVVLYNWILVARSAAFMLLTFAAFTGLLPLEGLAALSLILTVAILVYEVFVFCAVLEVPVLSAVGLALVEVMLAGLIEAVMNAV